MITRNPMADWIPPGYVGPAYANGNEVLVTKSGLCIGLLCKPPVRSPTEAETQAQDAVLWGRPLGHDQRLVTALCTAERRP